MSGSIQDLVVGSLIVALHGVRNNQQQEWNSHGNSHPALPCEFGGLSPLLEVAHKREKQRQQVQEDDHQEVRGGAVHSAQRRFARTGDD